jgi:hypothetical protein
LASRLTSKAGGQKITLGITLILLNWVVVGSWGVNKGYQVSNGSKCKAEEVLVSEKLQAQMITWTTHPPPLCINWHLWLSIQSHLERIPLESGFPINQSIHPSIHPSIRPPNSLNIFHNFVIQASLRQNLSVYMLIM